MKTYYECADLVFRTQGPLFIGSGKQYGKTEYLFSSTDKKYIVLNELKFIDFLIKNNLLDAYESFIMQSQPDLLDFFRSWRVDDQTLLQLAQYTGDSGDVLKEERSRKNIVCFVRNGRNEIYIPGSSIKGALRTALLWEILKSTRLSEGLINARAKEIEASLLNTLPHYAKHPNDMLNSVLKSIQVADSAPLDNNALFLTDKQDISVQGQAKPLSALVRECIKPGTEFRMRLTIDTSIQKNITLKTIEQAIANFGKTYKDTFVSAFRLPPQTEQSDYTSCLVLGGGSGYFGKSIHYVMYTKKEAVKKTSEVMMRAFKSHHHENDEQLGISPHMLKYGRFKGRYAPFGLVHVRLDSEGSHD